MHCLYDSVLVRTLRTAPIQAHMLCFVPTISGAADAYEGQIPDGFDRGAAGAGARRQHDALWHGAGVLLCRQIIFGQIIFIFALW